MADDLIRADIAAAREAELRAKIEQLGREVNISRYGQPDFAWSIHTAAMDDLRAEVERLRDALKFYADPSAWNQKPVETVETVIGTAYRNEAAEMQKDRGARARATLAKIGRQHD